MEDEAQPRGQGRDILLTIGGISQSFVLNRRQTYGRRRHFKIDIISLPSTALTAAQVTAQETATGMTGQTRTGFGASMAIGLWTPRVLKGPEAAELDDAPHQVPRRIRTDFRSAALAIEGTQKDTYYGSVSWGWKLDAAGKFSMIPFKAISQGTPSVNFLTAASVWNKATEDFNWGVSAATANILDPADMSKTKATVTKGTALNWGGAHGTAGGVTYNLSP